MKKLLLLVPVIGVALTACASTVPHKAVDPIIAKWASETGLPVTLALGQETDNFNPMAINDARLALSEDSAPPQLESDYIGTVEAYLALAYDENDPTLAYRVNMDAATAHRDHETFLLTLNQLGIKT